MQYTEKMIQQFKELENNLSRERYELIKSMTAWYDPESYDQLIDDYLDLSEDEQAYSTLMWDENFYSIVEYLEDLNDEGLKKWLYSYETELIIDDLGRGIISIQG